MKLLLPTGIALILLSCSKSSSPNNPPTPTSNLVTSLIAFNPVNHSKSTEKFKYDSSKNLVILNVRSDDTSQGVVNSWQTHWNRGTLQLRSWVHLLTTPIPGRVLVFTLITLMENVLIPPTKRSLLMFLMIQYI